MSIRPRRRPRVALLRRRSPRVPRSPPASSRDEQCVAGGHMQTRRRRSLGQTKLDPAAAAYEGDQPVGLAILVALDFPATPLVGLLDAPQSALRQGADAAD